MKQRTRRLALFIGGAAMVAAGLFAAACSTDSAGTTSGGLPTVKPDTGVGSETGPVPTTDGGTPDTDGGNVADADCSSAPKLRDNSKGFYCSFVSKDGGAAVNPGADGGDPHYCTNDEVCCNPGKDGTAFPASYCAVTNTKGGDPGSAPAACAAGAAAAGSTWPAAGSTAFECGDKSNCGASQVCCMVTAPDAGGNVNVGASTSKTIPKACGALQAYKLGGTRCAASCTPNTEIQLCAGSAAGDCQGTTKCTPFEGFFRDMAYCR